VATLRELRRLVGDKTGDLLVLRATHVSVSNDTFRDMAHLSDRGDRAPSIVNRLLYFSGGSVDNLQHEAAVTDYASDARTITFDPRAPVPPQVADEVEIWSVNERIGSISAIHRLINYSIDQVRDIAGEEVYADPQTYLARTNVLTIPDAWAEFGGAEYLARGNLRYGIHNAHLSVQPGLRTVRLRNAGASLANNRPVYVFGYARCLPLSNEDDETPVNAEWIVESVAEALVLGRSWATADPAAAERRASFWSARAALYRRSVMSARRGLGIGLPG
jgi:hypothetical protein